MDFTHRIETDLSYEDAIADKAAEGTRVALAAVEEGA